ncbi:MAG: tetratricopeptide repeat protein [Planctomycetota bacterium]|nr:tetratricopeptide repeat protein [Planctomycetota bacterium]
MIRRLCTGAPVRAPLVLVALALLCSCTEKQEAAWEPSIQVVDLLSILPTANAGAWDGRWEDQALWPHGAAESYAALAEAFIAEDFPLSQSRAYALLSEHAELPPALHILGLTLFRLRRYNDAAYVFERFIAHAPGQVSETRALGHCYYSVGRYEEAHEHYRRIMAVDSESTESAFGLALTEMRRGEFASGMALLESVLEKQPAHADAAYWRARLSFDEELVEWKETQAACEVALDLAPTDPRVWFLSAEIAHEQGDIEAAASARSRFEWLESKHGLVRSLQQRLLFEPHLEGAAERLAQLREEIQQRVERF